MYVPFEEMPYSSRIWIYQSDRPFTKDETTWIADTLRAFCDGWNTHGQHMATSFEIVHHQVIILSVDERSFPASGCSIDSSVRVLREIENTLGLNLLDAGKIAVVHQDSLSVSKLSGIKAEVLAGNILPESKIIDPTVSKKADLMENWIITAKDSWLKRYFN
ncbi:MAG: hypothetical protein JJU34_02230 [Lunatimonas sp.]|uniref:hypothetical protein n=1 Tax=Lunatimonas sp. TaxID=2060141 RepID=UPI00263B050D|nr:hypothetical protein [Lunatimonas sp.]MCC5936077.1 hypothetical protein [Lunatimonas sp.]